MSSELARRPQDPPKKKKVKVTQNIDGHPVEVEIEVDDVGGPTWPARDKLSVLNRDIPRVDGPEKVTGRARYTHDMRLPGMVWARLLLCPVPKAKVKLDVAAAKRIEGVVAAKVLREGETRFLGDPIAVVAAKTPELAEDALRALEVELENLPWAITAEQAKAPGAAKVFDRGNLREDKDDGSLAEVEEVLAGADAVVEATYTVPVQHHASLETHGLVVDYRGGDSATVYLSTQAVWGSAGELKGMLGVKSVEVICEHMGGGFGSKFGPGFEGKVACDLAKELKVPVHLMLTRRDEFLFAGNRSGCTQTLKGGATKDGTLVGLAATVEKFGGLGSGSHPGQPYIYRAGRTRLHMLSVNTHLDGNRAMRAPGHPQASFGIESLIDELAFALKLDPLAMRLKNLGDAHRRQLERAAKEIGWHEHPQRVGFDTSDAEFKVGIGFGVSHWGGGGGGECKVALRLEKDGTLSASVGSQDLGTGTRTLVAAIVAEEFGLRPKDVDARIGRSSYGSANGSGGSQTAASLAPSVKDGAFKLRELFAVHLAKLLGTDPAGVSFEGGTAGVIGGKRMPWKDACATLPSGGLSALGEWVADLQARGVQGAQAIKVQVDTRTGAIQPLDMVCVQNVGLPINRLALRSQIQGGMIQALSYGLFEERVLDPDLGLMLNANLEDYKLAMAQEMPEFRVIIEDDDLRGVIGVGEPPIIPGHSALANAVFNACGVRVREMPLTPDKVLMGLLALGKS